MVAVYPLTGITIIDMTTNIAGPLAGRILAELGADVIHVEPPWGDDGRNSTTAFLGSEGILYSTCNRSKRGIVVDVKTAGGQEVMRRLLKDADVFLEATVTGTLDRLGLGYETLKAANPRLIQVSLNGWGARGPLANEPGYAVLAMSYAGGVRPPQREGDVPELRGGSADHAGALLGSIAVLSGLQQRQQTGEGSLVTTSVFQGALHMTASTMVRAEEDTLPPEPAAAGLPAAVSPYRTKDGRWLYISAWNDRQFKRLMEIAGFPHIGNDPKYATRRLRGIHRDELNEVIVAWVATQNLDELNEWLRREKIPAAPMRMSTQELYNDPHMQAAEMFIPVDHPTKGRLWQLRGMVEIDGDAGIVRGPAPLLGEHTDDVLAEAGFTDDEIAALRAGGAVA